MDNALTEDEQKELLDALESQTSKGRQNAILKRLKAVDLAVLLEFPAGSDPLVTNLEEDFYICRPKIEAPFVGSLAATSGPPLGKCLPHHVRLDSNQQWAIRLCWSEIFSKRCY